MATRRLLRLAAVLSGIGLVYAYPRFEQDKKDSLARLRAGSLFFQTPSGPLEYAVSGEGQPVLLIHGAGGGYEQGLLLTRSLDPAKYQAIAISRPGYRQTPVMTARTPADQADIAVALLDHLGIERAVVMGISAGGLTSLQFAARHPERCASLVMVSAVTPINKTVHAPIWVLWLLRAMMSFDFAFWLLHSIGLANIVALQFHINGEQLRSPENLGLIEEVIQNMFPISDWREGTINDIQQLETLSPSLLTEIRVPTLIIHGTNDIAVPYEVAKISAKSIPGAKLVTIPDGSHFVFGSHVKEIRETIESFLSEVS